MIPSTALHRARALLSSGVLEPDEERQVQAVVAALEDGLDARCGSVASLWRDYQAAGLLDEAV